VGYLHLTPYISAHQLVRTKGGKNYKENAIRFILENSSDKKFILLGDDTQHDMKIYHTITQSYPDKILRIYIHKTRKSLTGSKKEDMEKLLSLPVSTIYFTDSADLTQEYSYINNL
jgi:phosphatidate phosphatase APP1